MTKLWGDSFEIYILTFLPNLAKIFYLGLYGLRQKEPNSLKIFLRWNFFRIRWEPDALSVIKTVILQKKYVITYYDSLWEISSLISSANKRHANLARSLNSQFRANFCRFWRRRWKQRLEHDFLSLERSHFSMIEWEVPSRLSFYNFYSRWWHLQESKVLKNNHPKFSYQSKKIYVYIYVKFFFHQSL